MTHQYTKLPVTMKMWMQFNVMSWTLLGVDAVLRHAQDGKRMGRSLEKTEEQFLMTAVGM